MMSHNIPTRTPPRPDPRVTPTTMKGNYPKRESRQPSCTPYTKSSPLKRRTDPDIESLFNGLYYLSLAISVIIMGLITLAREADVTAFLIATPISLIIQRYLKPTYYRWFKGTLETETSKNKNRSGEQMVTLSELFDGYEPDEDERFGERPGGGRISG